MITITFTEIIRNLNKDMHKVYNKVEKMVWNTHKEFYKYIVGRFGSTVFNYIRIYEDGKSIKEWNLKRVV